MKRLSSVDAQFLAMEDGRTHSHVCQLTVMEGTTVAGDPVTMESIRTLIAERIHLMPPFRWKLQTVPFDLDYPVFVEDPDFDLDSHLWELAIPAPGGPHQLGDLVARLDSRPLDRSRPLWEIYFIEGLDDGRVAVLTKVHHALVDGMSGLELLGTLMDHTPEGREITPERKPPKAEHPSELSLLARGVVSLPMQQLRMVRALPATLRNLDQSPSMRSLPGSFAISAGADAVARRLSRGQDGEILERPAQAAPKTSFSGRLSAQRRFAFGSVDFETIRAIKESQPDMTVNDVVVALCAGALRRRLLARGDRVGSPLVALIPISVHEQDSEYGNNISALIVAIPTDEAKPLARLKQAHEVMKAAKTRYRAMPAKMVQEANYTVPPALFARVARAIATTTANGWIDAPFNLTISNLPGSREPLYLAGSLVVGQYPVNILIEGVSLSLTLLSYQDRMDLGFVADRDLFPDIWDLKDDVVAELAELAEASGVQPTRRAAPRARARARRRS